MEVVLNMLLYKISITLILLFVLIYPKGYVTLKLKRECESGRKLKLLETLECYVPIHNIKVLHTSLYGESRLINVLSTLCAIFILTTLTVTNFITLGITLRLLMSVIFILGCIVWYVIDVIQTWRTATLLQVSGLFRLLTFAPPMLNYILAEKVQSFFHRNRDIAEGTFDAKD